MSVKTILAVSEAVLEAEAIGANQQMAVSTDLMTIIGQLLEDQAKRIRLLWESQSKTQAEIERLNARLKVLQETTYIDAMDREYIQLDTEEKIAALRGGK